MSAVADNSTATLPTDEERRLQRDSVRGFLEQHWPADKAVGHGDQPAELRRIWRQLAGQGVTALCSDPAEGGLRELVAVMQELGRAACPVPLADAALLNLLVGRSATVPPVLAALAARVHAGDAMPVVAFAGSDPERNAGAIAVRNGRASGTLNFLDGALAATHLLVAAEQGTKLAIVATDTRGVAATATRAMGMQGLASVTLTDAAAELVPAPPGSLDDLLRVMQLAMAARATGAADRSFELAVQYAKDRKQFGQLIGRYQAIQHKLATAPSRNRPSENDG